eukprot:s143_g4.t1
MQSSKGSSFGCGTSLPKTELGFWLWQRNENQAAKIQQLLLQQQVHPRDLVCKICNTNEVLAPNQVADHFMSRRHFDSLSMVFATHDGSPAPLEQVFDSLPDWKLDHLRLELVENPKQEEASVQASTGGHGW